MQAAGLAQKGWRPQEHGEDDGVDHHHGQGVDHRPAPADDRALVLGAQLAQRQIVEKLLVLAVLAELYPGLGRGRRGRALGPEPAGRGPVPCAAPGDAWACRLLSSVPFAVGRPVCRWRAVYRWWPGCPLRHGLWSGQLPLTVGLRWRWPCLQRRGFGAPCLRTLYGAHGSTRNSKRLRLRLGL
jgi:hypothetical protein